MKLSVYIYIIINKQTKTNTMTIQVTPSIKNKILKGIAEANRVISKEMNYSEDLRNNETIEKYTSYINHMIESLKSGIIKVKI